MRTNLKTGLLSALALAVAVAAPALAQAPPKAGTGAIDIPFEHYTLPNGLNVILSVDRTIPQAAVDVW
jgi:zinc protease